MGWHFRPVLVMILLAPKLLFFTQDYVRLPNSVDMCEFGCDREENTLCKYCPQGPVSRCGSVIVKNITAEEKHRIVSMHNEFRREAAAGVGRFSKLASLMHQIEWHDDLAKQAQRWADQCLDGHDNCRRTCQFYFSSQNIAKLEAKRVATIEELVHQWTDEGKFVGHDNGENKRNIKGLADNYYVMIYERTTKIGCGLISSSRGKEKPETITTVLVCNYAPGGFPEVMGENRLFQYGNRTCEGCVGNFMECVHHLCVCNYGALCYVQNQNVLDPTCPQPRMTDKTKNRISMRNRIGSLIALLLGGVLGIVIITVYVFVELYSTSARCKTVVVKPPPC